MFHQNLTLFHLQNICLGANVNSLLDIIKYEPPAVFTTGACAGHAQPVRTFWEVRLVFELETRGGEEEGGSEAEQIGAVANPPSLLPILLLLLRRPPGLKPAETFPDSPSWAKFIDPQTGENHEPRQQVASPLLTTTCRPHLLPVTCYGGVHVQQTCPAHTSVVQHFCSFVISTSII